MTRATKILPPVLPSWSIPRPALENRLDEGLERRLTTVVAGAGFGKSTALARWSSVVGSAWHTIDERDKDLGTFARGLVASLRRRVPDLPEGLAEAFDPRGHVHPDERTRIEAIAAHLSEALEEGLDRDLALVLDPAGRRKRAFLLVHRRDRGCHWRRDPPPRRRRSKDRGR